MMMGNNEKEYSEKKFETTLINNENCEVDPYNYNELENPQGLMVTSYQYIPSTLEMELRTENKDDVLFDEVQENTIDYSKLEQLLSMESQPSPFVDETSQFINNYEPSICSQITNESERFMFYSKLTGIIRAKSFLELSRVGTIISDAIKKGDFWLDVTSITDEEMHLLARIFSIHPLTVEDINQNETNEKCELFHNYYFVNFRAYHHNSSSSRYLDPVNVYNVVLKKGIITFHQHPTYHINSVLNRISTLKDHIHVCSDWINYAIIDSITDSIEPLLNHIQLEVDTIDELVLILKDNEQSDMLIRIGRGRKRVTALLRLLNNKPEVVKALKLRCHQCNNDIEEFQNIQLYLSDIQDHLITMVLDASHYEKVMARAHSNYLAQITIELTKVSNRTNNIVAKLTGLASMLLPMTVITGLWGMNVHVPGGQETAESESFFWFIGLSLSLLLVAFLFFIFVKRKGLI